MSYNKRAVDYVEKSPKSIFLNPVDENEVEAMINNLKESSPGWDAISPKLLKYNLPSILKTNGKNIEYIFGGGSISR